ncbi:MAG: cell surface protein SprA, partial [Bacteroidetes bacterium]
PNNTGRRTTETGWGRVPLTQQITTAFDIDPENRRAQDVGLDGMPDSLERQKFNWYLNRLQGNIAPDVLDSILQDPSNDNFRHFRDYPDGTPVEQRYSRFYGTEGNSPPQEGSSFVVSSTTLPDGEDLDRDRTLNETESYFQYRIPIRFDGSRGIDVDSNPFITESIESEDGRRIWYRFRVPLNLLDGNPNFRRVGGIQDFRSIRFIRMYFKEFERKMNFRFARLELVRNQWRRYRQALGDRCASLGVEEDSGTEFDVDAVNIEENSTRAPFGYTLPPGITRERALGVNLNALQNEQALTLSVCNLEDGDARGIYKIVDLDMRVFKKLRMFVHAEEKTDCDAGGTQLDDGDLTVFIRLGSDFQKNYYEYELPLAISRDFTVPYTDPAYQRVVWRAENDFDVDLQKFVELKLLRNKSGAPVSKLFALPPDDPTVERGTFKIIGNPSLGLVKSVMIGIRNPSARAECNGAPNDDGLAHSVEVWVNELRVSGLDERGGVAATARADFQLADFGSLSFSGRVSSIGWGGLDQQLDQRAKEEIIQYDVASNVELGKFFPENSGLRIPFFFQFSQDIRNPQFDPYDLDVELKEKLNETPDPHARDSIREQAQTVTTIKSLNFTNVRKERTRQDKKPMPWDVANFSLTYAYDQTESRDPIIEQDVLTRHRAALDYQYQRKVKYIEPLKNAIEKDKYLKFITGMNFNPLPNSFGFSTELDRRFNETKYRFAGTNPLFNTYFNKQFLWNRSYDLQWDLTRNL